MYKMSKEQRNKSFESIGISLIYPDYDGAYLHIHDHMLHMFRF